MTQEALKTNVDPAQNEMHASLGAFLPVVTGEGASSNPMDSPDMDYDEAINLLLECSNDTSTSKPNDQAIQPPHPDLSPGLRGDCPTEDNKGVKASSVAPEAAAVDNNPASDSESDDDSEGASGNASEGTPGTKTVIFNRKGRKDKKPCTLNKNIALAQGSVRQAGAVTRLCKQFGITNIEEVLAMLTTELKAAGVDTHQMYPSTKNRNDVAKFCVHHAILFEWLKMQCNSAETMPMVIQLFDKVKRKTQDIVDARALEMADTMRSQREQQLEALVRKLKRKNRKLKEGSKGHSKKRKHEESDETPSAKKGTVDLLSDLV